MRKLLIVPLAGLLALSACAQTQPEPARTGGAASFDPSSIAKVDDIAAKLPKAVAERGVLTVASSADYAPAEYLDEDVSTVIGYDADLIRAVGAVLGLRVEIQNATFDSILPAIGSKYDVGISSFTITPERLESTNMISYIEVGSSFATQKGNPRSFDPDKVCGHSIGVLSGTWQADEIEAFTKECETKSEKPVEALVYDNQADVTTNLAGGKFDAMYADSTVTSHAVKMTEGALEEIGGVRDAAPQGIVVAQKDMVLAEAVQAALQHLMDEGEWKRIAANWGVEDAILTTAELNPSVS